jgi:hypothetical protein
LRTSAVAAVATLWAAFSRGALDMTTAGSADTVRGAGLATVPALAAAGTNASAAHAAVIVTTMAIPALKTERAGAVPPRGAQADAESWTLLTADI